MEPQAPYVHPPGQGGWPQQGPLPKPNCWQLQRSQLQAVILPQALRDSPGPDPASRDKIWSQASPCPPLGPLPRRRRADGHMSGLWHCREASHRLSLDSAKGQPLRSLPPATSGGAVSAPEGEVKVSSARIQSGPLPPAWWLSVFPSPGVPG